MVNEEELKKEFHDKMFELRLKQAYYIAEHKESNPELEKDIAELKRTFAKTLAKERIGEIDHVEYKRK